MKLRAGIARFARAILSLGVIIMAFGGYERRFSLVPPGCVLCLVAIWGLMENADADDLPFQYRRPYLKMVTKICVTLLMMSAAYLVADALGLWS